MQNFITKKIYNIFNGPSFLLKIELIHKWFQSYVGQKDNEKYVKSIGKHMYLSLSIYTSAQSLY